ncbi:MAG: hypothetical protein WC716_02370 [Chitinophagaceae bacterium]
MGGRDMDNDLKKKNSELKSKKLSIINWLSGLAHIQEPESYKKQIQEIKEILDSFEGLLSFVSNEDLEEFRRFSENS